MNGLYRMFLGDARPNHSGDEWVFQDVDSIQDIIIPAVRVALKVHQVGVARSIRWVWPSDEHSLFFRALVSFNASLSLCIPISYYIPLFPFLTICRTILLSRRNTRVLTECSKPYRT